MPISATELAIQQVDSDPTDAKWKEEALKAIKRIAERQPELFSEDIWRDAELNATGLRPHLPDVLGPVMRRAARLGYIEPTNRTKELRHETAHRKPARIWKSRLCKKDLQEYTAILPLAAISTPPIVRMLEEAGHPYIGTCECGFITTSMQRMDMHIAKRACQN